MHILDEVFDELNRSRAQAEEEKLAWEAESRRFEAESRATKMQIDRFLKECAATACSAELYAIWLAVWISQGGNVTHPRDYNFNGNHWLMPTRSTEHPIPTAYGAQALHMVVWMDEVSIPERSTSGDHRRGWEWGHGTVHRLSGSGSTLRASTNQPDVVESYPDIEELLRSLRPKQFNHLLRNSVHDARTTKEIER